MFPRNSPLPAWPPPHPFCAPPRRRGLWTGSFVPPLTASPKNCVATATKEAFRTYKFAREEENIQERNKSKTTRGSPANHVFFQGIMYNACTSCIYVCAFPKNAVATAAAAAGATAPTKETVQSVFIVVKTAKTIGIHRFVNNSPATNIVLPQYKRYLRKRDPVELAWPCP